MMGEEIVAKLEGKSIYIILLGIVAVLTLTVAILVIFLFVTFNNPPVAAGQPSEEAIGTDVGAPRMIPADELRTWNPFATADNPNAPAVYDLMPTETHKNSFVQVTLILKYDVGSKRRNEEKHRVLVEEASVSEIKQACSIYFKGLDYEDTKSADAIPKAQDYLIEEINRIVNGNAAEKVDIVYRVIIENMLPQ